MTSGLGKTAVITGASSGVGRSAAIKLASEGWNIIGLGRDPQRSADATIAIRAAARTGSHVHMITGSLDSLADTDRMATAVLAITPRIEALCNNAGGVRAQMRLTDEGNEITFAGNHLGHFLLTKRLMPAIQSAAGQGGSRIINVSSEGHHMVTAIDWDNLQGTRNWASGRNYCVAKLCNLLFTHELARRHAPDGIVAHGMHPGEADTNFASHAIPSMQDHMASQERISGDIGGHTLAWLVSSEAAGQKTNGYYFNRQEVPASPLSRDVATARRLWAESEGLLERSGF